MILRSETQRRFVAALTILSLLCIGLFSLKLFSSGTSDYFFIPGNLVLAWASLIFAWLLSGRLADTSWRTWPNVLLTLAWLVFLPNSWYVITDLIHLNPAGEVGQLYDIVLIDCLVLCGFLLGFSSLYIIHRELLKRLPARVSLVIIEGVILLSSFAIYLGRILRWSTWDIITNPTGIILNISDRVVHPTAYGNSFAVTALFFVALSVMYLAFWIFIQPLPKFRR